MKKTNEISIGKQEIRGEGYATMVVRLRETGEIVAEYRLTRGHERAEMAAMRRAINRHMAEGGTVGNYQW